MLSVTVALEVQMSKMLSSKKTKLKVASKTGDNLMLVADFAEKYSISVDCLYVAKKNGAIPDGGLCGLQKGDYRVNESFFLRREAFAYKVRKEALENYYALHDAMKSNASIARLIIAFGSKRSFDSTAQFMSDGLFKNKPYTILANRISGTLWEFWRSSRWIIRVIKRIGSCDEKSIIEHIQ